MTVFDDIVFDVFVVFDVFGMFDVCDDIVFGCDRKETEANNHIKTYFKKLSKK